MIDFSNILNLPLIFGFVIALAIFLYVLLDGFDLGVGILFPFAPSDDCRSKIMNSVAPFWDGNETWLVLGGAGLFATFPLAYSIIMPTFYIPIIMMLLGLIFRGVAFEFRSKSESKFEQKIWDCSFFGGSLIASFFQGVILGSFIQGVKVEQVNSWDWVNPFSLAVGLALIVGYSLLGSTWLIMKTHGKTQKWARKFAFVALIGVTFFMICVSFWSPSLNENIFERWLSVTNVFYLLALLFLTVSTLILLVVSLVTKKEFWPFLLTIFLFILCYFGIVMTVFPYVVPYQITLENAAASPTSLSFLFVGVVVTLPVILGYTAYSYWVFRGKASHEKMY